MNQVKKNSFTLLVILILSNSYCSLDFVNSTNGTIVRGPIRRDTIWTKEKSPYILEDDLTVMPGVSLKIEEGVIVDCCLWSIIVEGELRMIGSPEEEIQLFFSTMPLTSYNDARIVFTENSRPWKENSIRGCQFEFVKIYCEENTMRYGLIKGGIVKLDHVTIYGSEPYSKYYTLTINGSISNCIFVNTTKPIKMGNGQILGNRFENSIGPVITLFDGTVKDNIINGGKRGIDVKKGLIYNNTISNLTNRGIITVNSPTSEISDKLKPIIVFNLISNCGKDAIYISGGIRPIITQNIFLDNNNGIYFDKDAFYEGKKPEIYYNAFYNNTNNVYFNREDPRIEIKLQKNWWGTNDTELIEDKIYYESDDPRLTATLYQPILTEIPHFLPRIPYEISLINQSPEVELDDLILLSGNISPPLKIFELTIRYDGPDKRYYEKRLNTDTDCVFVDEFSPPVKGIWNISIAFEESERYSYELFQQVLVINPVNVVSSEQTLPSSVDGTEDSLSPTLGEEEIDSIDISDLVDESNVVSSDIGDNNSVDVVDLDNESPSESPDMEDMDSVDDVTSGNESGVEDSEIEDNEIQLISYTEEETEVSDPLIFGFIPSILIIIIMSAIYIGTEKLK